jgi:hypothetical protein
MSRRIKLGSLFFGHEFLREVQHDASKNSPLFEVARLLVRFDYVARFIVNVNHGVM